MALRHEGRPGQGGPADRHADSADSTRRDGTHARLAWYRWYPGDYFTETQGWPWDACAAYRALLDAQWNMGSLPMDPKRLRTVLYPIPPVSRWRAAWPYVEPLFPIVGGGRQNARLTKLREEDLGRRTKQQAASKTANDAKRRKREGLRSFDSDSESDSDSVSDSDSDSGSTPTPTPTPTPTVEESPQRRTGRTVRVGTEERTASAGVPIQETRR
jgi:uncharacterized protein YdaU (DUF1376 family)